MLHKAPFFLGMASLAILTACGGGDGSPADGQAGKSAVVFDPAVHKTITAEQAEALNSSQITEVVATENGERMQARAGGAAPALSVLRMNTVYSTNVGSEGVVGRTSTVQNHGGVEMLAFVFTLGYGNTPYATMNGAVIASNKIDVAAICKTSTAYVYCVAGQTAVGWMYQVDLSGFQSGLLAFQQTSLNSPWNTMSASIYIQ
jgi:hypothetical protein